MTNYRRLRLTSWLKLRQQLRDAPIAKESPKPAEVAESDNPEEKETEK
jgi:hypothetical protein